MYVKKTDKIFYLILRTYFLWEMTFYGDDFALKALIISSLMASMKFFEYQCNDVRIEVKYIEVL